MAKPRLVQRVLTHFSSRLRARSVPSKGNSFAISGPSSFPVNATRNGMKSAFPFTSLRLPTSAASALKSVP